MRIVKYRHTPSTSARERTQYECECVCEGALFVLGIVVFSLILTVRVRVRGHGTFFERLSILLISALSSFEGNPKRLHTEHYNILHERNEFSLV